MSEASAPGKLILCGEHAVVYALPAIALPVEEVSATATVRPSADGEPGIVVEMADTGEHWEATARSEQPLARLVSQTFEMLGIAHPPTLRIVLRSTIPIASGMGSGAALGAALVRALATAVGRPLDAAAVSTLVYESERGFHGTPSGIDNTVVSLRSPIFFQRRPSGPPLIEPLALRGTLALVIGDTGVRCPTRLMVRQVRERFDADQVMYQRHFDAIGRIVLAVRDVLRHGAIGELGALLDENHRLLQQIGVSSPELERLVGAARNAGASGAKLSGSGGGGIMVALAPEGRTEAIVAGLKGAGATRVIVTQLTGTRATWYNPKDCQSGIGKR